MPHIDNNILCGMALYLSGSECFHVSLQLIHRYITGYCITGERCQCKKGLTCGY